MKNGFQKFISILAFQVFVFGQAFSLLQAAGTSSAQFLKMGAGARAAGMGDAFSAVADDVTATYWNPAGLGQIKTPEFSLMHNSWLIDTQYEYIGMGVPYKTGALGFSFYTLDHGTLDRYTAQDAKEGSFKAGSLAGGITFSHKVRENIQLGLTGKYVQESIEKEKASGFSCDLGVLFQRGRYNFSATLQHLGPELKMVRESFSLPQTVTLGGAARFFDETMLLGLDISKPRDNDLTLRTGLEYKLGRHIALRSGYNITPGNQIDVDGLTHLSGGLGIGFGPLTLDYAFVPFGDLGNAHRISLLVRINKI